MAMENEEVGGGDNFRNVITFELKVTILHLAFTKQNNMGKNQVNKKESYTKAKLIYG